MLYRRQRRYRRANTIDGGGICEDKIRVNAIAPAVILPERVKKLLEGSKDIEKLAATHLHGFGLPIHMADMAVYLASDEAAITTGQILFVDSGATIR